MLVFQCNSEHQERLQVSRVTSESTVGNKPTGHSLGEFPRCPNSTLSKPPKAFKDINSHTSPTSGDLCPSGYGERKPDALSTQKINVQKENMASPQPSRRLTRAGKGWQQARLWQESGPSFAIITPVPLRLWLWGNISGPDPYPQQGRDATCILVQAKHSTTWSGECCE